MRGRVVQREAGADFFAAATEGVSFAAAARAVAAAIFAGSALPD